MLDEYENELLKEIIAETGKLSAVIARHLTRIKDLANTLLKEERTDQSGHSSDESV